MKSQNMTYFVSRLTLALIFFFHGLVPKLLFRTSGEIEMNEAFMPWADEQFALIFSGVVEIIFAIVLLALYKSRIPIYLIIGFACFASLAILIKVPNLYTHAFNPFSTNLALVSLGVINLIARPALNSIE